MGEWLVARARRRSTAVWSRHISPSPILLTRRTNSWLWYDLQEKSVLWLMGHWQGQEALPVVLPLDNITFRRWKQTHFYIHLGLLLPLGGLETVEKEHQKLYLSFAFYNAKFRSTFETGITRVHTMSRFLTTQQSKWLSQVNVVSGTHYHIRSTITMATEARIDAW